MSWGWLCKIGVHRWRYSYRDYDFSLPSRTCRRCGLRQVEP
jgi:hypothetical protein